MCSLTERRKEMANTTFASVFNLNEEINKKRNEFTFDIFVCVRVFTKFLKGKCFFSDKNLKINAIKSVDFMEIVYDLTIEWSKMCHIQSE